MTTETPDHPADGRLRARGRPFNTSSPLGKIMAARDLRVRDVEAGTGISYRRLSDYLARRTEIRPDHLVALSQFLEVNPSVLTGYQTADLDPAGVFTVDVDEQTVPEHADLPPASAFLSALKGATP